MPDDLKIPVTMPGAEKAKRDLDRLATGETKLGRAAEEAGRKGKKAGRDAAEGKKEAAGWTDRLAGKLKGLLGAYVGLRLARTILASLTEETEKMDAATRKAAESMTALLALSALKGERPEVQQAVWQMAVGAGRPIEQVAPAYYALLGGTVGMARERQQALMQQALLMGRTDPQAALAPIVGLFTTMATQQPQLSPQQIGNLLSQTIEAAKATTAEMAAALPSILSVAKVGGVPIQVPAAMFAFGTRRGGGVAEMGTAVRATMLGLLAPPAELQKRLAGFGFPARGDLMARIQWLLAAGPGMPPELQEALGGRRGIEAVAAIAAEPRAFEAEIAMMGGALGAPGSLLQQRLAEMYGEVPAQRYVTQLQQLEVLREREYQDPRVLREKAQIDLAELIDRRRGLSPFRRKGARWYLNRLRDLGWDPRIGMRPAQRGMADLLEQGYAAQDILDIVYPETTWAGGPSLESMEQMLRAGGAQPMQLNLGGTHYHQDERRDPAGRPRTPVGAGY